MEENKKDTLMEETIAVKLMQGIRGKIKGLWQDERGVGVIEIVLILVILIGLVLVFKEQITAIVNNAFSTISGDAGKIMS